jgi:hypothetical protein
MACNNAQEPLEALPSALNDLVGEAVCEHLARKRWDVHAGRFVLENIAECLEVRIAPAHERVPQLEGGNVGLLNEI